MADIELVIKITEEYYKTLHNIPDAISTADMLLIKYGTPLPEHHGRLIDADKLLRDTILNPCHAPYIVKLDVNKAETIIPATKEGAE